MLSQLGDQITRTQRTTRTLRRGSATAATGNSIAATAAYRDTPTGSQTVKTYLFAATPVQLTAGKTVQSVTLPSNASAGGMHVFAVAPAGSIVSGVSPGRCLDDNSSLTTNGNKIQIWNCNGTSAQRWSLP